MEKDIFILSQVVYKGFIELEKRQPLTKEDSAIMANAMLKVYSAGLSVQQSINSFKK